MPQSETGSLSINQNEDSDTEYEKTTINLRRFSKRYIKTKNSLVRVFLAELLGTFMFVFFGCSSVAQYKLLNRAQNDSASFLLVNAGFGFGILAAILTVGKVSGAHLNPAVSFGIFLVGQLSLLKLVIYTIAQFIGAFIAAAIVFVLYYNGLTTFGDKMYTLETAGIFGTYPRPELSIWGGFFDQFIGTTLFVTGIMSVADKIRDPLPNSMSAIMVGFLLFVVGNSIGYNAGFAVNPARDFGPRFFTFIAGWGSQVFSAGNYYFWIPLVAPMFGSLAATIIYLIFISNHF